MKQCSKCGEVKELTEFHKNARWEDGLQLYCKECHKQITTRHYNQNKDAYKARAMQAKAELRKWWVEYKETLKCECCGESRWWCLDFHHTDPSIKDKAVSSMVSATRPKRVILAEVAKCMVVCRNCHADIHYKQR